MKPGNLLHLYRVRVRVRARLVQECFAVVGIAAGVALLFASQVASQSLSEQHLRIGSRVTLPTPIPTSFRVAALSTNIGWAPGAIIMSAADYAHAWAAPTRAPTTSCTNPTPASP
ncbi:MAG TPA: hypothetical protein VN892_04765 [Solirubrobacteraceae bacterium]|nr:hypothetical protein [Solirubrobacteraceae bacterium]